MSRPKSVTERELIQEKLTEAKKALAKLRQKSDSPVRNGERNGEWKVNSRDPDTSLDSSKHFPSRETRSSSRSEDRASSGSKQHPRISTAARDNLVQALGYQVSQLEDDLKASLLSYFEQVERQKEDLINSFNVMQAQLLRHQQICQEQTQEVAEKDTIIQDLKSSKQRLEQELVRLKAENERNALESSSFLNGLDSSMDSLPESLSFSLGWQNNSGYSSDKSDVSENLMRENARLRGLLREQDNLDSSRLERKVDLQQKLCHSYDKDLASKDMLIHRLKAENKGMQSDVQSMQDEVLRVNANRLNAEKEKTRLQQGIQFKDEHFLALQEKLAEALEDREELKKYVNQASPSANDGAANVSNYEDEIVQLQLKCDAYKDKLLEKERFINSMKRDNQEMAKAVETLRKELAATKCETQRMKRENERLQRENADRDIDRLSTESSTKANNSTIARLKDKMSGLEDEVRRLQRNIQEAELREAALSQDVLSSVDKFTHAEQELYTTKKELAQLRGFYESTEKRKKELQNEAIAAREKIIQLDKELRLARESRNLRSNRADPEELESENREMTGEIARLNDALSSNRSELNELENAMESSREQISIQKVRLDGNETMIMRKDERIKELQEQLVELHNQNDALADEILRKNRETENIKMGKRLAEQERELLKSGKLPTRNLNRDPMSFSCVEPSSTPDSGYSETDGHIRRSDMTSNNRDVDESQNEENDSSNGKDSESGIRKKMAELMEKNNKLKEQEKELNDIVSDVKAKLVDLQEENRRLNNRERILKEEFEENENELTRALDDVRIKVSALQSENFGLKENAKTCEEALKITKIQENKLQKPEVLLLDQLDALESTPPLIDPWELDTRVNEPINDGIKQEQVRFLETAGNGELLDFSEAPIRTSEFDLQNAASDNVGVNSEVIKENQDLRNEIENYQTQLKALNNENHSLEAELKKSSELVKEKQRQCKEAERRKEELQNKSRKENAAKEANNGELQNELKSLNKKCNDLKSHVQKLKRNAAESEKALLNSQGKCAEMENKAAAGKKKLEEMEEMVEKAKEDEANMLTELGQAKTKIKNLENEANELLNEETQSVNERRGLQREKRNFEERTQSLEKEKSKLEKKMKELQNEKSEISQKWEDAKRSLKENKSEQRKLLEEKEDLEFEMNEMLKQKSREINNLREEIDMSEQKCEDLKSTWNNQEMTSSNLKGELLKVKEECIDLTNNNEKLYEFKKELVKDLEAKDKIVDRLKSENDELQNIIDDRENKMEKIRDKVKEMQEENKELKDEIDGLRKTMDLSNEEHKEVDKFVQKLQEEKDVVENQRQESISDLENALQKYETENLLLKEKLNKADRKMLELQKRDDTAQNELMEAETRAKAAERKVKELNSALQKSKEDINYFENKKAKNESMITSLEEDHSKAEEQQKILQRELLEAKNSLNDLEIEETDNSERQRNNDKKLSDLRHYNEELEAERDDFEYRVKDLKKKLDKEKKRVDALEDDLAARKTEKDYAVQELGQLKSSLSETEYEQNANLSEKEKLKKDLLESAKRIIDLEVEIESQREQIEELEKLLDQKRATVLDMEDNLKDSTESIARLEIQNEEDTRMLKSLKEDNTNLEKMLEKQKQLSEGYKNSLTQKDFEIAKLAFDRDDAEDASQLLKKDLARREGVNKANRHELEEAEKQLTSTSKKLQETKSNYDKVINENERLQKDLENSRKRFEMEGMPIEPNVVNVLEMDPLFSRKSSSSSIGLNSTDGRIKTLDDKLTKAQTKVTDLENELSKEIRRHEKDCIKTRPTLPYSGKRSGHYDVSGMNTKYGIRRSDSSDSELSGSVDEVFGKNRGFYRRKSIDSTDGSLDRGSDFDSKWSDKNTKAMSSNTPQTPTSPVFTFDLPSKPKDRRLDNQIAPMTDKQSNDSFSETSSRDQEATEDVPFDHSILNELISEFNEAEKQNPLLQEFLLDQSRPDDTSSPCHNDSFDIIQPTYTSKRQNDGLIQEPKYVNNSSDIIGPPSEKLLDFGSFDTASDITNVTDVTAMSEPIQTQNQSLLDFDPFSNIEEKQTNAAKGKDKTSNSANNPEKNSYDFVNEEPGVFDRDTPNDIDAYLTPFDMSNWDAERNSSFEAERTTDFFDDKSEMDKPVLILINDKKYSDDGNENSTEENVKEKEDEWKEKQSKTVSVTEHEVEPKVSENAFASDFTFDGKEDDYPLPDSKPIVGKLADSKVPEAQFSKIQVDIALDSSTESTDTSEPLSSDKPTQEQGHSVRDFVRLAEENKREKRSFPESHKPRGPVKPQHIERQTPDIPQATQVESSNQQIDKDSDDEQSVSRKPSEIIKQLEQKSFNIGKPGTRPPRPKRAQKNADLQSRTGNDDDVNSENEATVIPEPKPRRKGKKGQERGSDGSVQEQRPQLEQITEPLKKTQIEDPDAAEAMAEESEDRQTAMGRIKVMSLIAAFEGKEV